MYIAKSYGCIHAWKKGEGSRQGTLKGDDIFRRSVASVRKSISLVRHQPGKLQEQVSPWRD